MKIIAVIIIRNFCSCEKKAWRNFRLVRDSNPWPLRYRWSTLIYVRSVSNSLRKRLCLTKNEMNHGGGICEPLYHLHQLNSFVNCTSSGSIRWKLAPQISIFPRGIPLLFPTGPVPPYDSYSLLGCTLQTLADELQQGLPSGQSVYSSDHLSPCGKK